MTLKDISNGPEWTVWIGFGVLLVLSIYLLTGRGGWLIAGYNTSSKEEQQKYDEKKLCRVSGAGLLIITILLGVMGIGQEVLPAAFAYVFLAVTIVDCIVLIIIMNKICKK